MKYKLFIDKLYYTYNQKTQHTHQTRESGTENQSKICTGGGIEPTT